MNTLWVLLAISAGFTYFYFKQKWNALWAIVTAFSFISISIYIIASPPTGITSGSFIYNALILIFIGAGITVFFLWFRNRDNKFSDTGRSEFTEDEERKRNPSNKSITDMSDMEYKAYLRTKRNVNR